MNFGTLIFVFINIGPQVRSASLGRNFIKSDPSTIAAVYTERKPILLKNIEPPLSMVLYYTSRATVEVQLFSFGIIIFCSSSFCIFDAITIILSKTTATLTLWCVSRIDNRGSLWQPIDRPVSAYSYYV